MVYPSQKLPVPASCAHLNLAAIEAELVRTEGNITAAATALSVPSADLRKLVWSSSLADTVFEQLEETIDEAQQVLRDGLKSADQTRRLQTATILLTKTPNGRARGWGSRAATLEEPEPPPTTLRWVGPD